MKNDDKPYIAHFVPGINEEASGPSYTVPRLCEALIESGTNCRLYTLKNGHRPDPRNYVMESPYGIGPKKLGNSPHMYKEARAEAEKNNITLIHNHSIWMMPNVYPGWISKKYRLNHVLSPRGVFTEYALSIGSKIKPLFWACLQKPSLESVTCFHATAESEYLDIRRMGYRQPIAIIPNGIDVTEPSAHFSGPRTVLFLGRMHPNKGVHLLLDSWSIVEKQRPDWILKLAGGGDLSYEQSIDKRIKELKLDDRVIRIGPVYGAEKFRAYRDAQIYVLPSFSENFGVTVAEALSVGVPSIVTQGAPWKILETEKAGLWPEQSVRGVADALLTLSSKSPAELKEIGLRGVHLMTKYYSWKRIAKEMNGVYSWLTNNSSRPSCVILD
jgi:glycosyltransferase involved in cell wall biosynthesis